MSGGAHVKAVQLANLRLGARTPTGSVMVRLAVTVLLANTKQKMVYLLPVLLVDVTLVVRASTMIRTVRVSARTVLWAGTVLRLGGVVSTSACNVSEGNTRTFLGRQLHVRIVIRANGILIGASRTPLGARIATLVHTVTSSAKPTYYRARSVRLGGTHQIQVQKVARLVLPASTRTA